MIWSSCALTSGLLSYPLAQQRDSLRYFLLLTSLTNHCELTSIRLYLAVCSIGWLSRRYRPSSINMIINRILDASEIEAAIQDGPAVFLVTLTEARVLMKLSEDFIQGWNWVVALLHVCHNLISQTLPDLIALKVLQLFLNRFRCQLIIFTFL